MQKISLKEQEIKSGNFPPQFVNSEDPAWLFYSYILNGYQKVVRKLLHDD